MTNNHLILVALAALAVGFAILGFALFGVVQDVSVNVTAPIDIPTGTAGDTFSTDRIAQGEWDTTSTASGTLVTLSNFSGRDRVITSIDLWVNGLTANGLNGTDKKFPAFTLTMATSTGSAGIGAIATGTRAVLNFSIATSSATNFTSSTSPGYIGGTPAITANRLWPNGTYLNLLSNISEATTTDGIVTVHYNIED